MCLFMYCTRIEFQLNRQWQKGVISASHRLLVHASVDPCAALVPSSVLETLYIAPTLLYTLRLLHWLTDATAL